MLRFKVSIEECLTHPCIWILESCAIMFRYFLYCFLGNVLILSLSKQSIEVFYLFKNVSKVVFFCF